jgi:hypothetical protein
MMSHIISMRWTIIASLGIGILLSMVTPWTFIDSVFPVVVMDPVVVQKTQSEVLVQLSGKKQRDCKYEGISAYNQVGQHLRDLNIERVDKPAVGITRPKGSFDFGTWRIWPTDKTKLIAVYVQYDCSGRDVHVRAAEVAL